MPTNNPYIEQLRKIVLSYVGSRAVKIYLFGSRATNKARSRSDIDLGFLPLEPVPIDFFSQLRELIEESSLPYSVDIVDLSQTDTEFRDKVLKEGITWKD